MQSSAAASPGVDKRRTIAMQDIEEDQLSETIPSRVIWAADWGERRMLNSTWSTKVSRWFEASDGGLVAEFWDLQEARAYYTEQQGGGNLVRFCCPSILAHWESEEASPRGALIVHLALAEAKVQDLGCVMQELTDFLLAQGPCVISDLIYQHHQCKGQFKFFVEYSDSRLVPRVCTAFQGLRKANGSVRCIADCLPCHVYLNDRLWLFASDPPPREQSVAIAPPICARASSDGNVSEPSREFDIDLDRIAHNQDLRTTCMLRNIPNKYTQSMLIEMIDETHAGTYDFIYLRMDFKNKCNVGYAFINFIDPRSIISFAGRVMGKRWPKFNSDKVCHLTYARIQGKLALLEKFRHSRVMMEPASYRPKVFYSEPDRRGIEAPFPY